MATKEQQRKYCKDWNEKNPEKRAAATKKWYDKNKDRIHAKRRADRANNREKLAAAKARWEAANPEAVSIQKIRRRIKAMNAAKNTSLRFHYEVTLSAFDEISNIQGAVCMICGQPSLTKRSSRLVVDHCHEKGAVRALLCHRCNCGIGYFKDSPTLVRRALIYLMTFATVDVKEPWPERVRKVQLVLDSKEQK